MQYIASSNWREAHTILNIEYLFIVVYVLSIYSRCDVANSHDRAANFDRDVSDMTPFTEIDFRENTPTSSFRYAHHWQPRMKHTFIYHFMTLPTATINDTDLPLIKYIEPILA
jgi:hypothetical protein